MKTFVANQPSKISFWLLSFFTYSDSEFWMSVCQTTFLQAFLENIVNYIELIY